MLPDADALPQLIGDYKPVDQWQAHINWLFYRFRGDQVRKFYQTFASADYRLAHALAADYVGRVTKREKAKGTKRAAAGGADEAQSSPLVVHEWGPGNGNLAACFLSHLKTLDKDRLHEGSGGFAIADRLDHPHLVDAAIAQAAILHRLAGAAIRVAVGDGARWDCRSHHL